MTGAKFGVIQAITYQAMKLADIMNDDHVILKYGNEYHLWKDDKYIGVATWTRNEKGEDCFQTSYINETGQLRIQVFVADRWFLNIRKGIVGAVYEYF